MRGSAESPTLHVCRTVHQSEQLVCCAGPESAHPAITLPWADVELKVRRRHSFLVIVATYSSCAEMVLEPTEVTRKMILTNAG